MISNKMKSLYELYRIGNGPSSSHTMAPKRAIIQFLKKYPAAAAFRVTLYGSMAATGRGHLTDVALTEAVADKAVEIIWKPEEELSDNYNGIHFEAVDGSGNILGETNEYSSGGGALLSDKSSSEIYSEGNLSTILEICGNKKISFWKYVIEREGEELPPYLAKIWHVMEASINKGINRTGILPGSIKLARKSNIFYLKSSNLESEFKADALVSAYAYAVSEESASGGQIVTAPTCGSSGVLPAVLYSLQQRLNFTETDIVRALATAGLFGNIVKRNGSISGACVGCQGEIGTACAMAAAASTQLLGGTPAQIEYAAEMGLEHHLGLTCDPVKGMVQIPCIERNAHAALRAFDCAHFALLSDGSHRISFDDVVAVMLETGQSLSKKYKETSTGGLARIYDKRIAEQIGEDEE